MNIRSTILPFAAIALTACVSTASQVSTSYYSVRGTTAEQIDSDIRRNGPLNGHALAVAAISFEPVSVLQEVNDDSCRFASAKFRVKAAITLPRWTDKSKSKDRDLKRAWGNLSRYARSHEQVHVRIAESFAKRLGEDIKALPPQSNCDRLDNLAKRVADRNAAEHDRAQKAFDAEEQRRLRALLASRQAS